MDWKEVYRKAGKVGKTALSWILFAILYPLCFFADADRSKLRPEIQVSLYFLCRVMVLEVGLLVLDIVSDFANGGNFILSGHPFVGGLTIVLVFLPGLIRAVTILDLYRQGKLDLSRVGLVEGKYTRTELVFTLTRVFIARVLFFPILPITMFLKSLFSVGEKDFEKDFQFGITDKFLESFSEAGPQMLLTLTVLLKSPGDFQVSKIMLLAVASSTFSVAKTASEAHVMLSSTKIPKILQWLPLLPYFLLTTLTRGFSIALLIAYAGLLYALIPLALLIISSIGLARWVAQMPTGMVILNSGLSALLSSQLFSTVPLATPESNLRTLKFLTWNTITSFIITTLSYVALVVCLESRYLTYTADTVPFFTCYNNNSSSDAFFCPDDGNNSTFRFVTNDNVSHEALYKLTIPFLLSLWILCLVYALLIYPGRVFFKETYMKEEVEKEENKRNCNCLQFLRKCCKSDEEEQNVSADETELMMISEGLKEKNVLMKHDRSISYSNGLERCDEGFELSTQRHRSYSL